MTSLPEPFVSLVYNGVDVGSELAPHVLDVTYTDNLSGKVDEIAVTVRDDQGLWRGPWRPEKGDLIVVSIGYRGGKVLRCGTFKVDIPRAGGSRGNDTLSFRAVSAFPSTALRSKRSVTYEKTTLKKIAEEVGGRHGLSLSGEIDDVAFEVKRQRRERDLGFLRRLAEDYGHFVSIKDGKLVFYRRETIEGQSSVATFELTDPTPVTDWSAEEKEDETYSKARVQYLHPTKKALIKVEVSDETVTNGDVLNIDERVETEGQAKKLAKGRLAKTNEDKRTASLTVVGDPALVAGVVVALGSSFGKYAGTYLAHTATHPIRRADYTTRLELKGV